MTIIDLVSTLAEPLRLSVVLTGPDLLKPSPTILYANPAFAAMSGYGRDELLGRSPLRLQGDETNQLVTRTIARELRQRGRFHGRLKNYRRDGKAYICEIDVRELRGSCGQVEAFVAFEREVVRRRGHPSLNGAGRYRPLAPCADLTMPVLGETPLFG